MNNELWDYKMDGKINAIPGIVVCLVLSGIFVVLAIDQLLPQPNKTLLLAVPFSVTAIISLSLFIRLTIRYFCFKVYIGSKGFYFQSIPFNGNYYEYANIKGCREERKMGGSKQYQYLYYFIVTEQTGKTIKFQFEKSVYEREINALKTRIETQPFKNAVDTSAVPRDNLDSKRCVPKKPMNRLWLFFIIILIATISSIGLYFAKTEQYKNWTTAPGVILKIEQYSGRHSKGGTNKSHRIFYSYMVNGETYSTNDVYSGYETDFAENDVVEIWYHPDNPSQSSFHKPGPGLDPFVPFFIGVPFALIAFGFTNRRTNRTRRY